MELPLEGYESIEMTAGGLCDSCTEEIAKNAVAQYHVRTGKTFCASCLPAGAAAPRAASR